MPSYGTTTLNALRYLLGSNKPSEIDDGFLALAEDVDQKMMVWLEGTFAGKPAAGTNNRLYFATDTGALYHDNGATWEKLTGSEAVTPATVGAPPGGVSVGSKVATTPSLTRPTMVYLTAPTGGGAALVKVGGVTILEAQSVSGQFNTTFAFIVPAGVAYEWQPSSGSGTAEGVHEPL